MQNFLCGYDVGCVMSAHSAPPFDPRALPIWQEATAMLQQQPPVAAAHMHAAALQQRFKTPRVWQTEPRHEIFAPLSALREAAVLIGLLPGPDKHQSLQVILTQRCSHLDVHPGQIAFLVEKWMQAMPMPQQLHCAKHMRKSTCRLHKSKFLAHSCLTKPARVFA